jgi:antitoxin component YwqK of YwqJK toxin-antitoxin module
MAEMNLKTILIFSFLMLAPSSFSQINDSINKTDNQGMKQGHWIKKYPDGHIQYNGYFKDNEPIGTFKRYFKNDTLQSVLVFRVAGKEAAAVLYYQNGFIASEGIFINQLKEGKWKFFSQKANGYLVCEEEYKANIRNGYSTKYYSDNTLAERVNYVNDQRNGEWIQYFPDGNICLRANYIMGKLHGDISVFFSNGKPEYSGQYKADTRNGTWKIYNSDGSLKYNIEYREGVAVNSEKYKKESDFLDTLEKNKGKIIDPAITGTLWNDR